MCVKNLSKLKDWQYTIVISLLLVFVSILIGISYNIISPNSSAFSGSTVAELDGITMLLLAVIIAPTLETAIFQALLLRFAVLWRPRFASVVVAVLFAVNHYSNIKQTIGSFFIGYVLNTAYLWSHKKGWNSFIVVATAHSLYNLFITIIFLLSN